MKRLERMHRQFIETNTDSQVWGVTKAEAMPIRQRNTRVGFIMMLRSIFQDIVFRRML